MEEHTEKSLQNAAIIRGKIIAATFALLSALSCISANLVVDWYWHGFFPALTAIGFMISSFSAAGLLWSAWQLNQKEIEALLPSSMISETRGSGQSS